MKEEKMEDLEEKQAKVLALAYPIIRKLLYYAKFEIISFRTKNVVYHDLKRKEKPYKLVWFKLKLLISGEEAELFMTINTISKPFIDGIYLNGDLISTSKLKDFSIVDTFLKTLP